MNPDLTSSGAADDIVDEKEYEGDLISQSQSRRKFLKMISHGRRQTLLTIGKKA